MAVVALPITLAALGMAATALACTTNVPWVLLHLPEPNSAVNFYDALDKAAKARV